MDYPPWCSWLTCGLPILSMRRITRPFLQLCRTQSRRPDIRASNAADSCAASRDRLTFTRCDLKPRALEKQDVDFSAARPRSGTTSMLRATRALALCSAARECRATPAAFPHMPKANTPAMPRRAAAKLAHAHARPPFAASFNRRKGTAQPCRSNIAPPLRQPKNRLQLSLQAGAI